MYMYMYMYVIVCANGIFIGAVLAMMAGHRTVAELIYSSYHGSASLAHSSPHAPHHCPHCGGHRAYTVHVLYMCKSLHDDGYTCLHMYMYSTPELVAPGH